MLRIIRLYRVPKSADLVLFHMIRDEANQLLALEEIQPGYRQQTDVESPLFTAFVTDFALGALDYLASSKH